ncbi:hypothetical protein, partial [Cloacibacillus evryensis]|uniref:hypothetical protein n=1 Tax=Cloacibacillus evryensis TaxID=508460 RepID=UPI003A8783F7
SSPVGPAIKKSAIATTFGASGFFGEPRFLIVFFFRYATGAKFASLNHVQLTAEKHYQIA